MLSSPFEAFNLYEDRSGLPHDFIRRVNSENPDSNAWARLERSELSPTECVFLDDLGINLKPAAAMGMKTIKVTSAAQALGELSQILSLSLD